MYGLGIGIGKQQLVGGVSALPTANLLFQYDAELGITLNGSNVSQWDDQSGNGRHMTQGTAANQPEYVSNGFGSFHTIRFDASNDVLANTSMGGIASPLTIYMVVKQISWTSGRYLLYGKDVGVGDVLYFTQRTSANQVAFSFDNSVVAYAQGDVGLNMCMLTIQADGNLFLQKNQDSAWTDSRTTIPRVMDAMSIGNVYDFTSLGSNIDLCYLVGYSVAHDAATRQSIQNYLNSIYAVF